MAPEKDYTHRSWIAVTLLIAVLIGLSLIPPQTLGGVSLRRANILSDLISFEEDLEKAEKAIDLDDADFHIDLTQVARQIADTVPQHAPDHLRMEPPGRGGRYDCPTPASGFGPAVADADPDRRFRHDGTQPPHGLL